MSAIPDPEYRLVPTGNLKRRMIVSRVLEGGAIAAAVIAGVSIKGGVGRVQMVALAALLLLTLTNAMDLLRIDPRIQAIFLGIIVVGAVALDELSQRRAALV